jgi:CrcB protein
MHPLVPIMLGGALGAGARYGVGRLFSAPWATLAVNLAGGFAMGLLAAAVLRGSASETMRLFAGVGVLGGFTTFSAFSLEGYQMIERGQWGMALAYALASVVGSIAALAAGFALVRA